MRRIDTFAIHHSASKDGSVAMFRREHIARGFGDIGYHWIIGNGHLTPDGLLMAGRPEAEKGCGVYGANTGKIHICLVGNFHCGDPGYTGIPSQQQMRMLGIWLLRKARQYHVTSDKMLGHKELTVPGHGTACPGNQFPLGSVRRWAHSALQAAEVDKVVQPLDEYLKQMGYFSTVGASKHR